MTDTKGEEYDEIEDEKPGARKRPDWLPEPSKRSDADSTGFRLSSPPQDD